MKHITDRNELEGKTIKRVADNGNEILMSFDDGSFCIFEGDYDGDGVELSLAWHYDKRELYYVDLITHEEFCELMDQAAKKEEEAERLQFEKLRAKYGN